ncbi:unnamed protein product [Ilex paraguariensis]|uniref:Uncharacterized protein n=1 Tax=Ilex paraguariensis TaxID=185542 RepID=A0ABC8QWX3_9AQUA
MATSAPAKAPEATSKQVTTPSNPAVLEKAQDTLPSLHWANLFLLTSKLAKDSKWPRRGTKELPTPLKTIDHVQSISPPLTQSSNILSMNHGENMLTAIVVATPASYRGLHSHPLASFSY